MTIAIWPVDLPQDLLQRGYNQSSPDTILKSSVDVGPAKLRRRTTTAVEPVSGSLLLTEAQLGSIRTFYVNTLSGGSLRFTWKDPVTLVSKELRFTDAPKWAMQSGWYAVQLSMEILP